MSNEKKKDFELLKQEEQLLTEISILIDKDFAIKLQNEFKSTYHSYSFVYYLEILERCKTLLLKDINDFDAIRKIIYKNLDYLF